MSKSLFDIRFLTPIIANRFRILDYNDIEFVEGWAFNGSDCAKLSLKGNKALSKLSLNAFAGLRSLRDLDLSETAITQLPTTGLEELEYLRIEDTQSLKEIPSVYSFKKFLAKIQKQCDQSKVTSTVIEAADTSNGWHSLRRRDLHGSWGSEPVVLAPPPPTSSPPKFQFSDPSLHHSHGVFHPRVEKSNHKSSTLLTTGHNANPNEVAGDESFHSTVRAPPKMQPIMCGTLYRSPAHVISCHPAPDAFNPCEDIMGTTWLRVAVWVVVVTAVFGNLAVIIVLASSHRISRMTVPKFLMCNLAIADLCMGTYLLLIAAMDIHSIGVLDARLQDLSQYLQANYQYILYQLLLLNDG
ncbi:hypothetical protein B566_EDAN007678 [Ephemera danica]|nr:hypothetical protein B566_EDAN007678 [Ephemera danica]